MFSHTCVVCVVCMYVCTCVCVYVVCVHVCVLFLPLISFEEFAYMFTYLP